MASPLRRISRAGRSFTEPPGLNHSALRSSAAAADPEPSGRASGIIGVFPTSPHSAGSRRPGTVRTSCVAPATLPATHPSSKRKAHLDDLEVGQLPLLCQATLVYTARISDGPVPTPAGGRQ